MPNRRLVQYLNEHNVPYTTIPHRLTYTAQESAASAHVPGHDLAKTVIVKCADKLYMAVLPASYQVDLDAFGRALGTPHAELATEDDFRDMFPDCEVGAMPPFGNLYGVEVVAAEKLAQDEEIVFNAGSHTELMRVRFDDFEREVHPRIARFAVRH